MEPITHTRRSFLKTGGLASVALGFPTIIPSSALGNATTPPPSERIVMGGIGFGNQGFGDMVSFLGNKEVQYVAVCDVRKGLQANARDRVNEHHQNKDCATYTDYREMLAREDIDAVHIATPDHWHAQQLIDACCAGKDVYCQKPETKNLAEGPLVLAAARRYGRVVSGGSQRVFSDYRKAVIPCWSGQLGTIKSINVITGTLEKPYNPPPEEVPDDIDWEMWLGPAPWAPYSSRRCSGDYRADDGNHWRCYGDYGNGSLVDWGAHHFGGATYALDIRDAQPTDITFHNEDGNKFLTFIFPNGMHITHNMPGKENIEVEGTPGEAIPARPVPGYSAKGGIYADFLNCVKTREKPFRALEYGVNTSAICHMAWIAYTTERSLKWDTATQQFTGDDEANRYLGSARRAPWLL